MKILLAVTLSAFACTVTLAQTPAALPDAPSATEHELPPAVPTGPTVLFDTTMGRLTCKLFSKESPLTVANFIGLATGTKPWSDPVTGKQVNGTPFYNGTTFHRVIPNFMIQGGDPKGTGEGDAGYYFDDEFSPSLRFDVPGRLVRTAVSSSSPKSPCRSSTASTPSSGNVTHTRCFWSALSPASTAMQKTNPSRPSS
jgi:peptidyl-prolyl cis-trans isomerase A (cyclophilin A)